MSIYGTEIGADVDAWIKHFKLVIDGDVIPDEQRDIFLLDIKPTKIDKREKDKELAVTIVSPVARDIDTAKSELKEQNNRNYPTDNDPITHFPENISLNEDIPDKNKRKQKSRKSDSNIKAKRNKISIWKKY